MYGLYEDLKELCERISKEIADANEKLRQQDSMNGGDIEYLDKLTHTLKSIKTTMAMMDADGGEYSRGYRDGHGYNDGYGDGNDGYGRDDYGNDGYGRRYEARGRGRYARRDSMGRYADSGDMVKQLESLMESAPDDRTRQEIQKIVQKMRNR